MQKKISTELYDFRILLECEQDNYSFELLAYDKVNKTKSNITNLNFIISELIEPIVLFEDYESTIEVNKYKGNKLYNKTIEYLNDKKWIDSLLNKLADDQLAGVWS